MKNPSVSFFTEKERGKKKSSIREKEKKERKKG